MQSSLLLQYVIYDHRSLIADVGGYLGLLLGQSMYGLYQALVGCRYNKICKRARYDKTTV